MRRNKRAARLGKQVRWSRMSYYAVTPEARLAAGRVLTKRTLRDLVAGAHKLTEAFKALPPKLQEMVRVMSEGLKRRAA